MRIDDTERVKVHLTVFVWFVFWQILTDHKGNKRGRLCTCRRRDEGCSERINIESGVTPMYTTSQHLNSFWNTELCVPLAWSFALGDARVRANLGRKVYPRRRH
jgi:hypothetical protein